MYKERILSRLATADTPVSGNDLAEELGISRTAIWKHIDVLRRSGMQITSHIGRGYTVQSDVLTSHILETRLCTRLIGRPSHVLDQVDSTNTEIMRQANDGAPEGMVVIANRQHTGRGRLGRRWHTSPGDTLAMSILLRPDISPEEVPQLSLMTAVAVHEALGQYSDGLLIKWPNDILHGRAKVAGILTEMRAEPGHVQSVVIGIGVNIRAPAGGWPAEIRHIATDLSTAAGTDVSRLEAAVAILSRLEHHYLRHLEKGFDPVRRQWWAAHAACYKPVRVHDGEKYIEGIAEALDSDGALLLRTSAGVMRIIAGDLELGE